VTVVAGTEPGLADYLPRSFATDPDVRVFTARLDGRPVGTSIAIRTGEIAGLYGVGTLPDARRRGIGTAASWAAVSAGRRWGCDPIVLQATELGLPIYERMGFRTVVRYITFRSDGARTAHEPDPSSRFNGGGAAEGEDGAAALAGHKRPSRAYLQASVHRALC
jgi:GNAT superfamily N-acetyltransferase